MSPVLKRKGITGAQPFDRSVRCVRGCLFDHLVGALYESSGKFQSECLPSSGNEQGYAGVDEISREARQLLIATLCPTECDGHIPSFKESRFAKAPVKRCNHGGGLFRRSAAQKSNHRRRGLLRPRGKRPARCASKKRDDLPPPHSITWR
jgi:hypothetical protein